MVDSVLSVGLQGVQSGIANARSAAQDIAQATTTDVLSDGPNNGASDSPSRAPNGTDVTADLTTAIVDLKVSEQQVKASAAVIKTADEMMGTVIDIKA